METESNNLMSVAFGYAVRHMVMVVKLRTALRVSSDTIDE